MKLVCAHARAYAYARASVHSCALRVCYRPSRRTSSLRARALAALHECPPTVTYVCASTIAPAPRAFGYRPGRGVNLVSQVEQAGLDVEGFVDVSNRDSVAPNGLGCLAQHPSDALCLHEGVLVAARDERVGAAEIRLRHRALSKAYAVGRPVGYSGPSMLAVSGN